MESAVRSSKHAHTSSKIRFITETAILVALTLIMGLTPLGTLRTPFLSVSLVTVPVALAAMLIGPAGALICATIFGATSFFNAVSGASGLLSTLFQISPIGVFVTAFIARMLCGLCTGYIFKGLHKLSAKPAAYYLTGLAAPLLNTFFFMSSLLIFFYHSDYIQNMAVKLGAVNPISFVVALVGVQGLIEAATGCLLAGTIGFLVAKALKRN